MADEADKADELIEEGIADALAKVRRRPMPAGTPGECEQCGYDSPRLVGGACAPCRDKYGLD